jgi:hypothetical protein
MNGHTYYGEEGWIAQANSTVDTFRSGLVRVKQDFICRISTAKYDLFKEGANFQPDLGARASVPNFVKQDSRVSVAITPSAIPPCYIFPAPSYQDLGNGFVRCTVTAYGTMGGGWRIDLVKRLGDYRETLVYAEDGVLKKIEKTTPMIFDVAIYTRVVANGSIVDPPAKPDLKIYTTGMTPLEVGGNRFFKRYLKRKVERYDITSYGRLDEIVISVSADGYSVEDTTQN